MAKQNEEQIKALMVQNFGTLKAQLGTEAVRKKFQDVLGKKAPGFISSIISVVNGSAELQRCEPMTIIGAAAVAAAIDLPIVPGLGFAGIVPYWNTKKGCYEAQFQIFKKGYVQLAQRSGQVRTIHAGPVYEGQLIKANPFTGEYEFDADKKTGELIIGYVAFLRLLNGFEKYNYMDTQKIDKHAKKYSQAFRKGFGLWADREQGGYEAMCEKTVMKLLLSGYAPLSTEMQKALVYDSAAVDENGDHHYIDNEAPPSVDFARIDYDKERARILEHLQTCNNIDEVEILEGSIPDFDQYDIAEAFNEKRKELANGK